MLKSARLICPESRSGMEFLAEAMPLALLPFCGKSLIDHALTELASKGYQTIQLYLSDRPELIRAQVLKGEKWGLKIAYHPTKHETNIEELRSAALEHGETFDEHDVFTLDRFPLSNSTTLFSNYETLFKSLTDYFPSAGAHQLGMIENPPGVWVGIGTRLPTNVKLEAPCWIGRNVYIADKVEIGPNTIIEDECLIDKGVKTEACQVAQRTYVGCETELRQSIAWGSSLVNWKTGSSLVVRDPFLLSRLDDNDSLSREFSPGILSRLTALIALILASPLALISALILKLTKGQALSSHVAISPHTRKKRALAHEFSFHDFNCTPLLLRRLPRLLSIIAGNMAWVGNPPLTPEEADSLETEFDQLWLAAPCGLVSLGDCYQHTDVKDLEARTHAAFFAAKPSRNLSRQTLTWLFFGSNAQTTTKT